MADFFNTRAGQMFEKILLGALEKIGNEMERANDLKEKELTAEESKKDEV